MFFFSGIVRLKSIQKTSEKARTQNSLPPENKNWFSQWFKIWKPKPIIFKDDTYRSLWRAHFQLQISSWSVKALTETCGAYWELPRSNCGSKNMPFNGCTLHRWTYHNLWNVWRTTQYQTHKFVLIKLHQIPKPVVFSETKSTWPYKIGTRFFLERRVLIPELFDGFVMDFFLSKPRPPRGSKDDMDVFLVKRDNLMMTLLK